MARGKFITFEGSEGSGKSTQIQLAQRYLKRKGKKILFVREPGGVVISEKIRRLLLDVKNKNMSAEAETLLYMAARAQLVHEVIEPALKKGIVVLCDRFLDSTVVYQGYGSGVDITMIKKIGAFATRSVQPDLTLIFDIPAKKGLSRIQRAKDRIEQRALSYHNRVRRGYQDIAKKAPRRIKMINANQTKDEIQKVVETHLNKIFG